MGGAVKAVANPINNVTQALIKPIVDATMIIPRTAQAIGTGQKGAGLAGLRPFVRSLTNPGEDKMIGSGSNFKTGVNDNSVGGVFGNPEPLNIAAPIDAAAVAEQDKKDKARAKRQAEIDILTDRPGRGGTILTDQYQYKV